MLNDIHSTKIEYAVTSFLLEHHKAEAIEYFKKYADHIQSEEGVQRNINKVSGHLKYLSALYAKLQNLEQIALGQRNRPGKLFNRLIGWASRWQLKSLIAQITYTPDVFFNREVFADLQGYRFLNDELSGHLHLEHATNRHRLTSLEFDLLLKRNKTLEQRLKRLADAKDDSEILSILYFQPAVNTF